MADGDFLERLRRGRGRKIATSTLGRIGKTARLAAMTSWSAFTGDERDAESVFAAADAKVIEELAMGAGELKGIAMKMGQILSYVDDALPPEHRRLLEQLQRWSPQTPWETVEATLREDLEEADALLATIDRTPVASASVGQVHRAVVDGQEVAVKVRHPDIERAMEADFKAALPSAVLGRLIAPGADVASLVEEAREGFLSECDYAREATMQERFAALYADHPVIAIPAVHGRFCGPRVLTTTWSNGMGFREYLATEPPQRERNRVGEALYAFYLGTLYRHGLFNADPHPGNLLFDGDRVVVLDHGCVRQYPPETVAQLVDLSRAVQRDDREATAEALVAMGVVEPKTDEAYATTRAMLRSFFHPVLEPGAHPLESQPLPTRNIVATKAKLLRLHVPGRLLFLFRIRFGLYAVLHQLGAICDWRRLEERLLEMA